MFPRLNSENRCSLREDTVVSINTPFLRTQKWQPFVIARTRRATETGQIVGTPLFAASVPFPFHFRIVFLPRRPVMSCVSNRRWLIASLVGARAALLAEGVMKTMLVSNLKIRLVSLLALAIVAIVATGLGRAMSAASEQVEGQAPAEKGNAPKVVRVEAPSEKEKDLDKKLQAPGDFSYDNIELRSILNNLSEKKGINIVIDPSANIHLEEGGELRVSLQLRDVPLETAFRHLMEAGKLGYLKQDGVLVVTSKLKSMVRKVYAVGTLVGDNEDRNLPALTTAIIRTVEPGTWWFPSNQKMFSPFQDGAAQPKAAPMENGAPPLPVEEGGPASLLVAGTIAYFPATKALVVRHYPEVHREIEELLAKLAKK
jgi:hypothetical protein